MIIIRMSPGKPDIVLPKYKTVIFVNGCFCHRHEGCKYAYTPKTNTVFWIEKITSNVERDTINTEKLTVAGWNVLIVWECEVRHTYKHDITPLIDNLINSILENQPHKISMEFYGERENKISIATEETLEYPSIPKKTD